MNKQEFIKTMELAVKTSPVKLATERDVMIFKLAYTLGFKLRNDEIIDEQDLSSSN